ncbi:DUF1553 domain-containing protein [Haloferula sp. A504]|uniref:PSD1 and planctomycete cytochrome C domain-containing protein n=1 Tax=Haloferula sp. A504 TaxID=3373601 RepID=UPI0031C50017|nr:DUF1553 domain-containing protein [Verrucomicrobiaceae bacterium E54]
MRPTLIALLPAMPLVALAEPISYNRDIRPILSENCFSCHGPDKASREAKLRLDVREAAIDRDAIVPGNAAESEMIFLINSEFEDELMPPPESHKSLTAQEKALLAEWINQGAPYESHWSYIPPKRPEVPDMGAGHPIDNFILAGLKSEKLTLSEPADDPTLIRRLSLDLTGLPPVTTGVTDPVAAIDRLLESPHFGERMAVHWLDLARYADTIGYHGDLERDVTPYRDYVIESFNSNKPYDRFIVEQLAGDLLDDRTIETRVASTFNRLNQISAEGGIQDAEYIAKYYAERVRATSVAFLGSTMGCAECHDHKFDPFSMKDFYAMEAFFADIFEKGAYTGDGRYNEGADIKDHPDLVMGRWGPELRLPDPEQSRELERIQSAIPPLEAELKKDTPEREEAFAKWLAEIREAEAPKLPKPVANALQQTRDKEPDAKQKEILQNHFRSVDPELKEVEAKLKSLQQQEKQLLGRIRSTLPSVSTKPRTVRLLTRGDWTTPSDEVMEPAFPEFLAGSASVESADQRLTRLDLARWIASPENPLTARAYVNRVWALFFGTGLSRDLQDLGNQGQWPTHPELLDWLAVEFMESGWNVKQLVRTIVTSRTYRQSSNVSDELLERDPYNVHYARQNPRRLDAEFIRDNALAVSGLLNPRLGGPSARPYQPAGYYAQLNFPKRTYQHDTDDNQYRRGLYMHWQRSFLHPMLKAFDAPSREECTASRASSNTPLQALDLLNDPTFVEAARALAQEMLADDASLEARIDGGFQQLLSRSPTPEETGLLSALHEKQLARYRGNPDDARAFLSVGMHPAGSEDPAELAAMTAVARVMLNLHESITRY